MTKDLNEQKLAEKELGEVQGGSGTWVCSCGFAGGARDFVKNICPNCGKLWVNSGPR